MLWSYWADKFCKMTLWDKGYDIHEEAAKFTVEDDYLLDQKLLFWDCIASMAHARMLQKIGILTKGEMRNLIMSLRAIIDLDMKGLFKIKKEQEDSHTAIEEYLTRKLGEAGKKIHTGRSRNDQALVALKLYMKKEMLMIMKAMLSFAKTVVAFAEKNNVPMPGFTHMRKAMISTTGLWAGAFAEAMLDNIILIKGIYVLLDSNPLGSAAGYGVPLILDRKYTAALLGFAKVQNNVLYVQNTRGKNEAIVLSGLIPAMLDLNKLATDLILFSMPEFGYFSLPEAFSTGSSIMPQKKNPDVLELVRAKSHVLISLHHQVLSVIQNLTSGYNRDFQITKKPLVKGIELTKMSLHIMESIMQDVKANERACRKGLTKEIFATDAAYDYVKAGVPFREAYKTAAKEISDLKVQDPESYIEKRNYAGAPGNLDFAGLHQHMVNLKKEVESMAQSFEEPIQELAKAKDL